MIVTFSRAGFLTLAATSVARRVLLAPVRTAAARAPRRRSRLVVAARARCLTATSTTQHHHRHRGPIPPARRRAAGATRSWRPRSSRRTRSPASGSARTCWRSTRSAGADLAGGAQRLSPVRRGPRAAGPAALPLALTPLLPNRGPGSRRRPRGCMTALRSRVAVAAGVQVALGGLRRRGVLSSGRLPVLFLPASPGSRWPCRHVPARPRRRVPARAGAPTLRRRRRRRDDRIRHPQGRADAAAAAAPRTSS